MSKESNINHEGVVIEIDKQTIFVEILSKSACASCHAKGACSLGDTKVKVVEVENRYPGLYEKGERVNVVLKKTMGYKALWISYVVPLIILLLLLVSLSSLQFSEPVTGISIIAALAVYYTIIWIMRDRLKREFEFAIEKLK